MPPAVDVPSLDTLRGLLVQFLLDALGRWPLTLWRVLSRSCAKSRCLWLFFPYLPNYCFRVLLHATDFAVQPIRSRFRNSTLELPILRSTHRCSRPTPRAVPGLQLGLCAASSFHCASCYEHDHKGLRHVWSRMSIDQLGMRRDI